MAAFERTRLGRVDVVYDEHGRPAHLLQAREQQGYSFTYDEAGRIVEAHRRLPDRSLRPVARYVYTPDGRLIEIHDARGLAGRYEYDRDGRIVRDETRGGKIYTIRYDRRGRCVYASGSDRYEERVLQFAPMARTNRVTNSHGHVTTYEYNPRGQVVKTTSPTGELTRAELDEYGRPASQTAAIHAGKQRVPGFSWHHNHNQSQLQLVDRWLHSKTGHHGGRAKDGGRGECH